ncbi:RNA-directed DNA polymerase from mobile element jockey [Eumeta japonica]|uniref:RNA-directed DNA polymerase from mobile element jockey n=1 Tax=Eumeta variegata TaxID=151549 RepID=A0A4C1SPS6_EUMVA|nr:RNA-directed DNA polymerase from mobile element jockey [Eumeta japonica]
MRHYAVIKRAEILAEHLEEQLTPHPTSNSFDSETHQVQLECRVQEFLSGLVSPLSRTTLYPWQKQPRRGVVLEGRSFFVAVKNATLDLRLIRTGVLQGSCLSPCLYGAFTDDILTLTSQLQDWEENVMLALYADDSAYLTSSRRASD